MDDEARVKLDPVSGTFGFRMDTDRARDGRRRQVKVSGYPTEEQALAEISRLRAKRDAVSPAARLAGTVRSLCEGWVDARIQELEPNSVYNYRWLLGLIYPLLGATRASALTGRAVGRVYQELEASGYSRTTLRSLHLILAKAYVEETGRALGARMPRPSDNEKDVWTLEEVRRFLKANERTARYPLWRLMALTGLRRGEVCGLKWTDLVTQSGMLKIRRQRVVDNVTGKVVEKPPKSHNGFRSLALDPETLELLQRAQRRSRSVYMFVGHTNQPLRPDNVTDAFNKRARAAGVRPLGPHQLRHLLASTLLDQGYGIHEVAERLGHDAATLMRYYAKVNALRRGSAAQDAAALIAGDANQLLGLSS